MNAPAIMYLYLPADIVNHIIIPYLLPPEKLIKWAHDDYTAEICTNIFWIPSYNPYYRYYKKKKETNDPSTFTFINLPLVESNI